jgi:hypothetical protein
MLARDREIAVDMEKKLDRMIEAIGLKSPQAKQRYEEMRTAFAHSHALEGHVNKVSANSPSVRALPNRKGQGPRRHS